jgi:hypothetical protein
MFAVVLRIKGPVFQAPTIYEALCFRLVPACVCWGLGQERVEKAC